MAWAAEPTGKRGRQPVYSDAAVQTCLTMKVLFGMELRETTGFVESLFSLTGLDWDVPDFSTLSRRQFDEATGKTHTLYSLLHTAICRRITNSEGRVNIFNLAKNAGTSVDQIERFYTRFLPLSKEIAKNLQSFGE